MGELDERRWGVISERGCEALGLDYAGAARLARELREQRLSGLCVVADETARHLKPAASAPDDKPSAKKTSNRKPSKKASPTAR